MSPDQREQLVRLVIAAAILVVAVGGIAALLTLESAC